MTTIIDFSAYAGRVERPVADTGPGFRTGEVIIFPGVRIDYDAAPYEDTPHGPSHSPSRARRRRDA